MGVPGPGVLNAAAGLATMKSGAREGMPTTAELDAALAEGSG